MAPVVSSGAFCQTGGPGDTVFKHSSVGSTCKDVCLDQPQGFYSQHTNMMRRRPEMSHALHHVVLLDLPLVSVNS